MKRLIFITLILILSCTNEINEEEKTSCDLFGTWRITYIYNEGDYDKCYEDNITKDIILDINEAIHFDFQNCTMLDFDYEVVENYYHPGFNTTYNSIEFNIIDTYFINGNKLTGIHILEGLILDYDPNYPPIECFQTANIEGNRI